MVAECQSWYHKATPSSFAACRSWSCIYIWWWIGTRIDCCFKWWKYFPSRGFVYHIDCWGHTRDMFVLCPCWVNLYKRSHESRCLRPRSMHQVVIWLRPLSKFQRRLNAKQLYSVSHWPGEFNLPLISDLRIVATSNSNLPYQVGCPSVEIPQIELPKWSDRQCRGNSEPSNFSQGRVVEVLFSPEQHSILTRHLFITRTKYRARLTGYQ